MKIEAARNRYCAAAIEQRPCAGLRTIGATRAGPPSPLVRLAALRGGCADALDVMNRSRRALTGGVAAAGLAMPLRDLLARQPARTANIGVVTQHTPFATTVGSPAADPNDREFLLRLSQLGWVEGNNLAIQRSSAEGRLERLPALMQEMVGRRVDVIVTFGVGAQVASLATATIPIVAAMGSPEIGGLTRTLARPSRNVTGISGDAGPGINAKRLQLLKEAAPAISRVAVIDFKYVDAVVTPGTHVRRLELQQAARTLGLTLEYVGAERVEDIDTAFDAIVNRRADGLLDLGPLELQRHRFVEFAARHRLPAVYASREYVEIGGLMAYGASFVGLGRRMAEMTDRVLRGAKPADLPIEQPTRFDLVVNARTAKSLDLALPSALLLRADEVIE